MASISFNNLKFSEKLVDAGMPKEQANVLAESIHEITNAMNDTFATKKDLEKLTEKFITKEELKTELTALKFELKTDIHRVESNVKVLNWMMGFLLAGVFSLVMKAFF